MPAAAPGLHLPLSPHRRLRLPGWSGRALAGPVGPLERGRISPPQCSPSPAVAGIWHLSRQAQKTREAYEKFLDFARLPSGGAELEGAASLAVRRLPVLVASWEGRWGAEAALPGGDPVRAPEGEEAGRRAPGVLKQSLAAGGRATSVCDASAYPPSGVSQQPPWKQGRLVS